MSQSILNWSLIIGKDSSWLWSMLQFFAVTITLIFIYFQVRTQTATHLVNTVTTINTRWNSEPMLRARYKYCSEWISGNKDFDAIAEYIAEFIEELGKYCKINAVPKDVMWSAQSWYVEYYYSLFKEGINEVRCRHHDPTLFQEFEDLFISMNKISKKNGAPVFEKQTKELEEFVKDEIRVAKAFLHLKEDDTIEEIC